MFCGMPPGPATTHAGDARRGTEQQSQTATHPTVGFGLCLADAPAAHAAINTYLLDLRPCGYGQDYPPPLVTQFASLYKPESGHTLATVAPNDKPARILFENELG